MIFKLCFILLPFLALVHGQGCILNVTCVICQSSCRWACALTDRYCLEGLTTSFADAHAVGAGETERCAGFATVGTEIRSEEFYSPKPWNKAKLEKTSKNPVPIYIGIISLVLTMFLFASCVIFCILKLKRRRQELRRLYPIMRYADDHVVIDIE